MKDEDYEDIMKILDDMNIYELFFKERELMGHFLPPINFFSAGHFHIKNGCFHHGIHRSLGQVFQLRISHGGSMQLECGSPGPV